MKCHKKRKEKEARGVGLYLEKRGQKVDNKMAKMDSFPKVIKEVLDEYANVFNTHLRKSMNVKPVLLNTKEDAIPVAIPVQEGEAVLPPRTRPPVPRGVRIEAQDIRNHGYTRGCRTRWNWSLQ